jgi:deazaflavin-dependent oxidoreductase (nitroreductase family)
MTKTNQAPRFVRLANILTKTLLRAGLPPSFFGYPMYLLTVRGRKSGQPHTTPVVIVEQEGRRYLLSPFGVVNWVRNLRASGGATFTRSRRNVQVCARELSIDEAGLVLKGLMTSGKNPPILGYFGVSAHSADEDFEHAAASHPVFVLESK